MKTNFTVTRRAKIIWGILGIVLIIVPVLGWLNSPSTPAAPVLEQNKSAKPALPKKSESSADKLTEVAAHPSTVPAMALPPRNLGELSDLRGELEKLKIQSQIEELKTKQIESLQKRTSGSATPQVSLPALTPPAAGSRSAPITLPEPRSGRSGLSVISVQGVGNTITATIQTSSGQTVVRPGSKIGDMVVTSISREGVSVRRAGKISNLPFE